MKTLIIDDSSTMRIIISRALKDLGHEIVQAEDGKQGLEVAKAQENLAFIFVDWNMPVMNGYEFVVAARADEKLKAIPIIMATTENERENIQKALDAGANEFILKPFTKESIQEKIALILAGKTF